METWDVSELDVKPHFPEVLRSDDEGRVIVLNLPAGEQLQEHQVHEHAYLMVVEGELELTSGAGSVTAGPGFLAHFRPSERHEVTARTDSRMLLLLAPWPGDGHPSERATS